MQCNGLRGFHLDSRHGGNQIMCGDISCGGIYLQLPE
jgi:hypothetical protein